MPGNRGTVGEVVKPRREEVIGNKVTYLNTKNSKNRTVPISVEFCQQITDGIKSGPVFAGLNYPYLRTCIKEVAPACQQAKPFTFCAILSPVTL